MSRYLSENVLAVACSLLKKENISSTHLSALRYMCALDAFGKKNKGNCDTRNDSQKNEFIQLVADVVEIDAGAKRSYLHDFAGTKPTKEQLSGQISSNFFTANAVRHSQGKGKSQSEKYPSNPPLFEIADEALLYDTIKYNNVKAYLKTRDARYSFAVWLARRKDFSEKDSLRDVLQRDYSKELVAALLPDDETPKAFEGIMDSFSEERTLINWRFFADKKMPRNLIYFGAPGTGKSYQLNEAAKAFDEDSVTRVTFYPDYSYAQFVGCFKPSVTDDGITYEYQPGPFLSTYIDACLHKDKEYLLIVEEINRANPAAVFGDIFQLLDRTKSGVSRYPVAISSDMRRCMESALNDLSYEERKQVKEEEFLSKLALPENMSIWATMNSADQGVFPMDSAFKRRWDFRYIGIDEYQGEIADIDVTLGEGHTVNWNRLRTEINALLSSKGVNEDKLLGPFFIDAQAHEEAGDFSEAFKNKVLLYIYEDAAKTKHKEVFSGSSVTYATVCLNFDKEGEKVFEGIDLANEKASLFDEED